MVVSCFLTVLAFSPHTDKSSSQARACSLPEELTNAGVIISEWDGSRSVCTVARSSPR